MLFLADPQCKCLCVYKGMKLNSVLGFKFNGKDALFESGFVKGFSKNDVLARNMYFFNFEKDRDKHTVYYTY